MQAGRSVHSDEAGSGPLKVWRSGDVWFRDLIPVELPWGREDLLEAVPKDAVGSYGARTGGRAIVDGQRYEPGEVVVVETEDELQRLLPGLGAATDLIFPWYERMVPATLLAPHEARIDLAAYRGDLSSRFIKALLLTVGLLGAGFAFPDLRMLALLMATIYGIFPLVESGSAWLRRVDQFSVEELNRRLVNFEFFRRWLLTKRPRLLQAGLAVLIAVFVGQMFAGLGPSIEAAALMKDRVLSHGEWWRIVTTGLMHGSILHILFNGMALYSLGRVLVALVSPSLLSCVFLFTVATGSLASLWLGHGPGSVGASGGILGCLGFLLVVTGKFHSVLPGFLRSSLLQSCLVVSIFGFLGSDFIDNAAHAGGFLGGTLLGMAVSPWLRLAPKKARPVARIFSVLSLAILAAATAKIAWELWQVAS